MSIISLNSGTSAHFMAQGTDVQASINLDRLSDFKAKYPQWNSAKVFVDGEPQTISTKLCEHQSIN